MSATTAINEIIHIRRELYDRRKNLFDSSVPISVQATPFGIKEGE